ncbi:MAG: hypothetical protein MUF42_16860 [Cytophagaceae bacterium]|jgi:hypothetical protein|nr:hypothetical protein [Cytophagaceae bacterium]
MTERFLYLILVLVVFQGIQLKSQSQGPLSPASVVNGSSTGLSTWTAPANAVSSNNAYATATNGNTEYIYASNFGFTIPATSPIVGISASIEGRGLPVNAVAANSWTTFNNFNYASGTVTSNYGSTNYSYNLPVSNATNNQRLLLVAIATENVDNTGPLDPSVTINSVTYNGVALTLASSATRASATTSNSVSVYYLLNASLPAATGSYNLQINKTINGETSGTVSAGEYLEFVSVNTFTFANQFTPVTAVSTTTNTSNITSPAVQYLRNGDYMVAATFSNQNQGEFFTPSSGYTENVEQVNFNTDGPTTGATFHLQTKAITGTNVPDEIITATANAASRLEMVALSVNAARVYDQEVYITKTGSVVGSNLATLPAQSLPLAWTDYDTFRSYGGATNLWGNTFTSTEINSSSFGILIKAQAFRSIAHIDHIRITVHYSAPLPVQVQTFSVEKSGSQVRLSTVMANQDNKSYLISVERSSGSGSFDLISGVESISGGHNHLEFYDQNPLQGDNVYRLKIVEKDNPELIEYSVLQKISWNDPDRRLLSIYPNPAQDLVYIHCNSPIVSWELRNMLSQIIQPNLISQTDHQIVISVKELPPGNYSFVVLSGQEQVTGQFVVGR